MSSYLTDEHAPPQDITPSWMIPLEGGSMEDKLIIGHNVSFDRSYVKEQYQLKVTNK